MTYREYTTLDKSNWVPGEWQNEPDKIQWQDEATGLPCLLVRNAHFGNLCGYVGVPKTHPMYGETDHDDLSVHGGITFSSTCDKGALDEAHGICHLPDPGEPDDVWWLGFDCAHAGDVTAISEIYMEKELRSMSDSLRGYGTYRNVEYVKAECARLAQQLHKMEAT